MTPEVLQKFKIKRSQRDITYQHQNGYNSGTDKLLKVKFGENYPRAERNA